MCFHVSFLIGWMSKSSPTHFTLEWFLPCVDVHVPLKRLLINKPLVALLAMHWHLVVGCVLSPNVVFESMFGEGLAAMGADVRLVM